MTLTRFFPLTGVLVAGEGVAAVPVGPWVVDAVLAVNAVAGVGRPGQDAPEDADVVRAGLDVAQVGVCLVIIDGGGPTLASCKLSIFPLTAIHNSVTLHYVSILPLSLFNWHFFFIILF